MHPRAIGWRSSPPSMLRPLSNHCREFRSSRIAMRCARFATWTSSTFARRRRRISTSRSGRSSRAITCSAKSLSRSRSREAQRIASASRAAGRVVMPCHQYRYNPVWVQLRKWLADGAIGRWHLAELHVYRLMADRGTSADPTPWRGLRADAGGGILLDHGTHLIYQMLDAAGVPPRVRAWTGLLRHRDYDVEDSAHLLFEYPERLGVMFLTWAARHRESHVRFIGDAGSIDWIGGVLRLERDGEVESFDYLGAARQVGVSRVVRGIVQCICRRDGHLGARVIVARHWQRGIGARRCIRSSANGHRPGYRARLTARLGALYLRIRPAGSMLSPRQKLVRTGVRCALTTKLAGSLQARDNHGGHAPGAVHRRMPMRVSSRGCSRHARARVLQALSQVRALDRHRTIRRTCRRLSSRRRPARSRSLGPSASLS